MNITVKNTLKRLQWVAVAQMADKNRFKRSPLGEGYLTRQERWNEVRWELHRRLRNIKTAA
jgi:hypothetical protein